MIIARHVEVETCCDCPMWDSEYAMCQATPGPDDSRGLRGTSTHEGGSYIDDGGPPDWCPLATGCVLVTRKGASPDFAKPQATGRL